MVVLEYPRRRWSARICGMCLGWSISVGVAEQAAATPGWQVSFSATQNGQPAESTAVPVVGDSILVAVVAAGADPSNPRVLLGSLPSSAKVIGHDPVSRLQFFQVQSGVAAKSAIWLENSDGIATAAFTALTAAGPIQCRTLGWEKQVGGKILPLALLRVRFTGQVPPPGTPLVDDAGRVAAVVFQNAGAADLGFAIPAEAVRRVQRDICTHGQLVRGWLGLALRAESRSPQVVRVLPESPAAAAGVLPGDMLVSVGNRQIADYADAANAFFYLIPGQAVKVKLLRGVEPMEFLLMPSRAVAK